MMNSKSIYIRSLVWFLPLILSFLLLSSCAQKDEKNENVSEDEVTLSFGISPWPPDALNYLAQEKGFFEDNGVKVELVWVDGYDEIFEKVTSGELNVWNFTLLDAIANHKKMDSGQAILVQDYSAGADAVATLSQMNNISELKGKRVGVEKGTVGEFFLNVLLNKEGLVLKDVELIDIASENILTSLKEGKIDAGVCYEPCPSDILAVGGKIIKDSKEEKNLIVDLYVAKKEHVAQHKDAYIRALTAIIDAGNYFNEHPDESAEIMQEVLDMPKEEIIATFNGLRIPNFRENKAAFKKNSESSSLYNLSKLAYEFLQGQNSIEGDLNIDNVINPELIESIDR